jgi:tRNA dimethylallyltransferase
MTNKETAYSSPPGNGSAPVQKTCIVIAGPTAVGKTAVAIALATHFKTAIISADSRQCFKELSIGVAKPTPEQLSKVRHYFINSHSIQEEVNAAVFETYALDAAAQIFERHDIAVMVGGTGLYLKAFCGGMDHIPAIPPEIRGKLFAAYLQNGLSWLQENIKKEDPLFAATADMQNPRRLLRALEVIQVTGQSIRHFQQGRQKQRPFSIIKIGLELPREILYGQVNRRVDEMVAAGLAEEVRSLLPFRELNALQTVGYSELFDFYAGRITFEKSIELVKKNTRHYAKRQMTWFQRDAAIKWFSPLDYSQILAYAEGLA